MATRSAPIGTLALIGGGEWCEHDRASDRRLSDSRRGAAVGFVGNLAVSPYHGTTADHLLARSIDLKPAEAVLVGIDAETALVRDPGPVWSVAGAGAVTVYGDDGPVPHRAGSEAIDLP